MIRGGSWNNNASNLLSSGRNNNTPTKRNNNIGAECAKTVIDLLLGTSGVGPIKVGPSVMLHSPPSRCRVYPPGREQCLRRLPRAPRGRAGSKRWPAGLEGFFRDDADFERPVDYGRPVIEWDT